MNSRRAFTLIELMVVVVIIGILASIVALNVRDHCRAARVAATRASLCEVNAAIELFRLSYQRCPERLEDLVTRPSYIDTGAWPSRGYVSGLPRDGWGRELVFRSSTDEHELYSLGEDGREGGGGFDADLR